MSALPPKADIAQHGGNVRFVPLTSDLRLDAPQQSLLRYSMRPAAAYAIPALTFNAYHLGGPGQGSREELDEHSQRRSGPEEWRPDPRSFRRHGRRSLAPDARQPGPVGAGHRRRRTGRYRDPG